MNRSLLIPGLCLAFVVAGVYRGETAKVDAAAQRNAAVAPAVVKQTGRTPAKAIETPEQPEFESLKNELLDGWPVLTKTSRMSRAGPRESLYASIKLASSMESAASHFVLANLVVVVKRKSHTFPLMVDRVTGRTHVFASNRWQEYDTWKPAAIEECLVSAGMKLQGKKKVVSRGGVRLAPVPSRNAGKAGGRGDEYDDEYGDDYAEVEKQMPPAVGEMPKAN